MKKEKVPHIRFPDFTDKWKKTPLGNLFTFKNGLNSSKEKYGQGTKFINVLDIIENDYITYDNIVGSVEATKKQIQKYGVIYGDILFQRSSETREDVGQANVYLGKSSDVVFGGFVIRGRSISDFNPQFLNFLLKTDFARNEITSKSGGSTRFNVGQGTLSEVEVYLPIIKEQQKIADFLSSVDQKIQQLRRKKELLEEYKKGVMQKLFSQEIRFKNENGEDYPDWEKQRIGKHIVEFKKKSTKNNQFEVLTSSNEGLLRQKDYYGDNRLTNRDNTGFNIIPPGYITFRNRSDVREFTFNENKFDFTGIVSSYYPVFKMKNGHNKFFTELTNIEKNFIGRHSVGTSQTVLSTSNLKSIQLDFPCDSEQKKISEFASSIDLKIKLIQEKVELAQTFKKGLLQQMFV